MATYNVQPNKAGAYFNKVQCFCFEEQRLRAGEEVDMPVFFYLDPEFASDPAMADSFSTSPRTTGFAVSLTRNRWVFARLTNGRSAPIIPASGELVPKAPRRPTLTPDPHPPSRAPDPSLSPGPPSFALRICNMCTTQFRVEVPQGDRWGDHERTWDPYTYNGCWEDLLDLEDEVVGPYMA